MDSHAIRVDPAPAPATPDIAVGVTADTIGEPGLEVGEHLAAAQRIVHDVEYDDVGRILRPVGRSRVHDIAALEVRREADAVRAPHRAFGRDGRLATGIDAVDARGQLELGLVPFVGPEDAITWVGEPDRPVGVDRGIVWRVELLARVAVHENGPGAVVFPAAHAARVMLHGDKPALVIARVAVRVPGLGLEHAHVAVVLDPAQRAMVRDVAPDEAAPVSHPHRAFAPKRAVVAHAVPDALQRRVALHAGEALVLYLPRRLGVGDRGLPGPVAVAGELVRRRGERRGGRRRRHRRRRGQKGASTGFHGRPPLVSWTGPISSSPPTHIFADCTGAWQAQPAAYEGSVA